MSDNTTQILALFLLILSVFLFAGEPDVTDAFIEYLLSN